MKRNQAWELVPLTEDIWIGGSTVCGFSANGGKVLGASLRAVRILMTTMRMVMSVMMNMLIIINIKDADHDEDQNDDMGEM